MFDLNDEKEFNTGSTIFNGGIAGLVKDVTIDVQTKEEGSNQPNYKLLAIDKNDAKINEGFYYPSANPQKSQEDNTKYAKMQVGRVLHAAKAVMGENYEFPKIENEDIYEAAKKAYDTLFKLIKENAGSKKFNVYTTYGNKNRPSQYLGLRYFDFIEPATEESKLFPKGTDMLERLEADAPSNSSNDESWLK